MAKVTASATSFSDTAINVNNSGVSISMGNTIAVTIGMSNSVFLGAKTSLTGGAQTNITLGPSSSFTYGNVLSATYGNSWSWSATNNTIYDSASRWGVKSNTYNGGISAASYDERWAEGSQGKIITLGVFISYLAMVGLSCIGIAAPVFTPTSSTDSSPSFSGAKNASITIISDTLGVILLVYAQYRAVQFLWNWRNFKPVSTLGLTSTGVSSFVYPYPDNTTTSPFASFTMLPGTAAAGPSLLEGYSNNAIPSISLTASLSRSAMTSSSININPSGVVISSSTPNGSPNISLDGSNGGSITITSDSKSATNPRGSIAINKQQTTVSRRTGKISLAVGSGATASQMLMQNNSINLSANGSSAGAIAISANGVTIGTGNTAAQFTANNITVGGANGVVLTNSSINIGGAIVVTGAALNVSLGQAITQAKGEIAQDIQNGDTALLELLEQATEIIEQMDVEITALKANQQEQQLATALLAAMIGGGGGGE